MITRMTPKTALAMLVPSLAALLVIFASIAACSDNSDTTMPPVASGSVVVTPSASVPNSEPSIRGFITRITNSAESTELLIEYFPREGEASEFTYDKALVKLDENTAIVSYDDTAILTASNLSIGSTVEVWYSEPTTESYPVLAYAQAVRVVTTTSFINDMRGLPQLTVTGSSRSLAGVISAEWRSRGYDYITTMNDMLEKLRGAHLSSVSGNVLTLAFDSQPKSFSVTYSKYSYDSASALPLEVDEQNSIVIPADAEGEIFVRVKAEWVTGTIVYGFSIALVSQS